MFALGDDEKATYRKEMNAYVCCKSFCNTSFLIVQLLTSAGRKTKTISLSS